MLTKLNAKSLEALKSNEISNTGKVVGGRATATVNGTGNGKGKFDQCLSDTGNEAHSGGGVSYTGDWYWGDQDNGGEVFIDR